MIESGRSVPEVAQSLGIGNNLIYYWLNRFN
jgi:transposase-like protein